VTQILDGIKVRLDGPRAWGKRLTIGWQVTDPDERHLLTVENGVLNHRPWPPGAEPEATLVIDRRALSEMLAGTADLAALAESGRLRVEGDGVKLGQLLGLLEEPDPSFPIVKPSRNLII
jgi:alkyl sulfatase BDS1-like metallo-beta-lactamase superfamily hydrolase